MGTQAVIFLVGFLTILGLYITLIAFVARRLDERVPQATFDRIERVLIGGIIVGVIAMFQPWLFEAYRIGFLLVLFSTLGFILWSHVTPALPQYERAD